MSAVNPQSIPEAGSVHPRQTSTELETHPQAELLVEWFKANAGWLTPDVQIACNDSSGLHLRAIRPLSSPVIVTCPVKLTLSHLNLDKSQSIVRHVDSPLGKFLGVLPNHVLTRLLLIEQRHLAKNGEGLWYPYIACLPEPEAMTASIWFDDDDKEYLAGTNLAGATKSTLTILAEEWEHAVTVLRNAKVSIPGLSDLTYYMWAATIMSSRSFSSERFLPGGETFPILFPVLDILNHSLNADIQWDPQPYESFTLKRLKHDAVQPGEEIFNNYFPKQNGEWLLAYGFCLPNNPAEQFAIKMAIPSPVEAMLRDWGLYEAKNVPFGMTTSFLDGNPNNDQHYLRTQDHPFGRYENAVPFFRGIPPWIVHLHFIMTLHAHNIEPADAQNWRHSSRITFEILRKLYEAIDKRSHALPLGGTTRSTFSNDKQRYASIYRDGQAKIIHAVREELWTVLDKLMVRNKLPSRKPAVVSTTEVLIALETHHPLCYESFRKGLAIHYGIEYTSLRDYSEQIALLEEEDHPAELSVWKLLLFVLAYLYYIEPDPTDIIDVHVDNVSDNIAYWWARSMLDLYLPPPSALEETEPALSDDLLKDFVHDLACPISELDKRPYSIPGHQEMVKVEAGKLGRLVALWAEDVVERFAFQLPGGDRVLMYMTPDETDDAWVCEGDV